MTNPIAPINLEAPLAWKKANPAERAMLQNLQGNILKGHGRDHTWNLFFAFGADPAANRALVKQIGTAHVTDALTQLEAAARFKTDESADGGTFGALFLSSMGYEALDIGLTLPAGNDVFAGMKLGVDALADPAVDTWEAPFQAEIHGMILIGDDTIARGQAVVDGLRTALAAGGATLLHTQIGVGLRNSKAAGEEGIEHFGYIDGRSQPLLLVEDIERERTSAGTTRWDPAFPLGLAIVADPAMPGDDTAFGSFFVFRKLEQNVAAFKTREQDLADTLGLQGKDRELAGAYVVGRFEDGTPVTDSPKPTEYFPQNNFNYDDDKAASRCPFHAHIRKTNPRGTGGFESHADERLHLMPRRGIPYEDTPRAVPPSALPEVDTRADFNQRVLPLLPTGGVGLLFMAYNARLDDQFAFTQRLWANNSGFPRVPVGAAAPGIDGVLGQVLLGNQPPPQHYPSQWGQPGTVTFDFREFVHMRGGEYFFTPSLAFLRNL